MVGGMRRYIRHAGTEGLVYYPIEKNRQKEAVDFLSRNAFQVPDYLLDQDILRRIESSGAVQRILSAQRSILNSLFQAARVDRLVEQEALLGAESYSLEEMMADVRGAIWSELSNRSVAITTFRRNLQRAYLELYDSRLNGETVPNNDLVPLIRGELQALDADLRRAGDRAANRITRLHIEDALNKLKKEAARINSGRTVI